jgi:nicotinamide phosphoribosyltransferase
MLTLIDTDSYKLSHYLQYPEGTDGLFAYLESRSNAAYPETVFFGLRYILSQWRQVTRDDLDAAMAMLTGHGEPFPYDGWRRVVERHHGRAPLKIRAVPEGSVVPIGNALMTVESTDPELPWMVSWLETQLMRVWYPCTVATRSRACRVAIKAYLEKTADDLSGLDFKLHDFGSRGASSRETAGLGGMAHLLNFSGTDTIIGIEYARRFYDARGPVGYSIPAMEHSTVIAWGREREPDAYRNMLRAHEAFPMAACVSDSYDVMDAVRDIWCSDAMLAFLKSRRQTVVIRPDSGDPPEVCREICRIIDAKVGCAVNQKGYRVLPPFFRIIQGDAMTDDLAVTRVLEAVTAAGYSADNLAFGMGAGLLQNVTRDTQSFAYKVSAVRERGGEWRGVQKNPRLQSWKRSQAGRLTLLEDPRTGAYTTVAEPLTPTQVRQDQLQTVFENGDLLVQDDFATIRQRVRSSV